MEKTTGQAVIDLDFPGLLPINFGKVRRLFINPKDSRNPTPLLMVFTDRLKIVPNLWIDIPGKGEICCRLSRLWMNHLKNIIPNHLYENKEECLANLPKDCVHQVVALENRSMFVREAQPFPVKCVVKGYEAGEENRKLSAPLVYFYTKENNGCYRIMKEDDAELYIKWWRKQRGKAEKIRNAKLLTQTLKSTSIALYFSAQEFAQSKGAIITEGKLEFGFIDGELHLIDEAFTPDSSKFWNDQTFESIGGLFTKKLSKKNRDLKEQQTPQILLSITEQWRTKLFEDYSFVANLLTK